MKGLKRDKYIRRDGGSFTTTKAGQVVRILLENEALKCNFLPRCVGVSEELLHDLKFAHRLRNYGDLRSMPVPEQAGAYRAIRWLHRTFNSISYRAIFGTAHGESLVATYESQAGCTLVSEFTRIDYAPLRRDTLLRQYTRSTGVFKGYDKLSYDARNRKLQKICNQAYVSCMPISFNACSEKMEGEVLAQCARFVNKSEFEFFGYWLGISAVLFEGSYHLVFNRHAASNAIISIALEERAMWKLYYWLANKSNLTVDDFLWLTGLRPYSNFQDTVSFTTCGCRYIGCIADVLASPRFDWVRNELVNVMKRIYKESKPAVTKEPKTRPPRNKRRKQRKKRCAA